MTAAFATSAISAGGLDRVPASEVHAKLVGTTVSVCGRSTLTWFKFWGESFARFTGPRCTRCLETLGLTTTG